MKIVNTFGESIAIISGHGVAKQYDSHVSVFSLKMPDDGDDDDCDDHSGT